MDYYYITFVGIALVAFLYSSVGHGGASGYIAVLTLANDSPDVIRPAALTMNIAVASIATFHFWKAGCFSWQLFWPFAILSLPFAYYGGKIQLHGSILQILLSLTLLYSAYRFFANKQDEELPSASPKKMIAILIGGSLGFLSGLTGTGGGIFLTPLLLITKWATIRKAAAVSAFFIVCNSIFGLLGILTHSPSLPQHCLWMSLIAGITGFCGSYCGSRMFAPAIVKKILAIVLLIAASKLLLSI